MGNLHKTAVRNRTGGFTLVEMMVAIAGLAIIGVAVGGMFFQTTRQAVRLESRAAAIDFQQQISMRLKSGPLQTPTPP